MTNQHKTFTNTEESQFFTESKFNFEFLAEITTPDLATRVKNVAGFFNISTFNYEDRGRCIFLRFYATDLDLGTYKVISCYWNKENYFDVDYITHIDMETLGLKVVQK